MRLIDRYLLLSEITTVTSYFESKFIGRPYTDRLFKSVYIGAAADFRNSYVVNGKYSSARTSMTGPNRMILTLTQGKYRMAYHISYNKQDGICIDVDITEYRK